jgi:hypothetical protein
MSQIPQDRAHEDTRAIRKVTSDELLTKQAMKEKNVLNTKKVHV